MANTNVATANRQLNSSLEQNSRKTTTIKQPSHHLLRWIATFLLALIVLVGLSILIIWLVVKPRRLVFSVEEAHVHGFNISHDNHLNASFEFAVRSYNPNTKVSVYYDKIESRVEYDDQTLVYNVHEPLFQPRGNVTRLGLKLVASNVALLGSIPEDLKLERSSGKIELGVYLKARIRFKVGDWKSSHRTLKIFCSPVLVHFSQSIAFERTPCDVEL